MPHVAAVVLAAGQSTRMGTHKLLLLLDSEPLVRRTVGQVCEAGYDEVLVVVGHEHDKVLAALDGLPIRHAVNPEYATGMGSSFRTAVEYLTDVPEATDAAMFALADQPFVTARDYRALLDIYRSHVAERPAIVSARYGDVTAPPHLFTRALFPELAVLQHGARSVLRRHAGEMLELEFPRELLEDIDTPDDYERAKSLLKKR